jgi:hypothetical protein
MVGDTNDRRLHHAGKQGGRYDNPAKAGNLAARRNGAKMKLRPGPTFKRTGGVLPKTARCPAQSGAK